MTVTPSTWPPVLPPPLVSCCLTSPENYCNCETLKTSRTKGRGEKGKERNLNWKSPPNTCLLSVSYEIRELGRFPKRYFLQPETVSAPHNRNQTVSSYCKWGFQSPGPSATHTHRLIVPYYTKKARNYLSPPSPTFCYRWVNRSSLVRGC